MNKCVCTVIHLANGDAVVNKKGKVLLLMHVGEVGRKRGQSLTYWIVRSALKKKTKQG